MDIFDSPYYKINKNLHRFLGCWPFQNPIEKYSIRVIILLLHTPMVIFEIISFIYLRNELEKLMSSLPIFLVHVIFIAKYSTYIFFGDKIAELFNAIKYSWLQVSTEQEYKIMCKYAETGRKISSTYCLLFYISLTMYLVATASPRFLDVLLPLNESRPYIFIFKVKYIVDEQKYYTPIIIHQSIAASIAIISIMATDSTYSMYTDHICGMFAIVRHHLDSITFMENSRNGLTNIKNKNIERIIDCIKKHNKAIWFCDTVTTVHASLMFVILLTSVLALSITGVQALSQFHQPFEAFQSALLCLGHLIHMCYYSWNSQKILDDSSAISDAVYNTRWYIGLDNTRTLLTFMMLRSTKPCVQTAGKIFPMTLMNFTVIVKTSMSYFTVLLNFQ